MTLPHPFTPTTSIDLSGTGSSGALQAVLFDMDGTLVDTEGLWQQAVAAEAALLGLPLGPDDQPFILGRAAEDTADHLHDRLAAAGTAEAGAVDASSVETTTSSSTKTVGNADPADVSPPPSLPRLRAALEHRFADLVRARVVPLPGALTLLDELSAAGVAAALVSASPRHVVDIVLDALGRHRFAVTVAAGETPRTKPEPDPYLAAAAALDVDPARCVAVEDTPTGIASAEAAGCAVLAVPSATPVQAGRRRTVIHSLLDADLALLRRLAAAGRA
ncbi:HAD family hydrolase [Streptacidiphilus cavernicola]|uniref:HAD family hydrolase n=1 Tax=Streptacidiphilus cavernicola TaxID=3342716 RepID=A0ABV6VTB9_9ACTN